MIVNATSMCYKIVVMQLVSKISSIALSIILTVTLFLPSKSQSEESIEQENIEKVSDPARTYDEIIDSNEVLHDIEEEIEESVEQKPIVEDELVQLLPQLTPELYSNWTKDEQTDIWLFNSDIPDFLNTESELFSELKLKKVLKQTYRNEGHEVNILIYKFSDFTGAYSAFTLFHKGEVTDLKVGKNASESDSLVNFWQSSYFIDIYTNAEDDKEAKAFIVLTSQEISQNIKENSMLPVVAIQLPALHRVKGSERYCLGLVCSNKFFTDVVNFDLLNFPKTGGIISAKYREPEEEKDISLTLVRYIDKESAEGAFGALKKHFTDKEKQDKEMDIDHDVKESILEIKNRTDDYIMLKQQGNLLAIAYDLTDKKPGKNILELVPWPIEIVRPL